MSPRSPREADGFPTASIHRRDRDVAPSGLITPTELLAQVPATRLAPKPDTFRSFPGPGGHRPPQRWIDFMLRTGARVTAIAVLSWALLFNFSEVRGSSMEPGIHDRDRILVDHFSYLFTKIDRGDVIVMRYPLDPSLDYIKRVVGLPGDQIVIEGGRLWVNGVELDEPYVAQAAVDPYTHTRVEVEPNHFFVLGDNRRRSSDSREFGQVPREYVRGKVRLRVWPPARAGMID